MYLKMRFLGIVALLHRSVSHHHPPPIRSQQHTLPILQIFLFFIFLFSAQSKHFCLCVLRRWRVVWNRAKGCRCFCRLILGVAISLL